MNKNEIGTLYYTIYQKSTTGGLKIYMSVVKLINFWTKNTDDIRKNL